MIKEITNKLNDCLESINKSNTMQELDKIKTVMLGKTGFITCLFKEVSAKECNKDLLQAINCAKQSITKALLDKQKNIEDNMLQTKLQSEYIDATLPSYDNAVGTRHILSWTIESICEYYASRGFEVIDGPEIDTEYYNFDALNIKKTHPARQSSDTFYINDDWLLRTQTSTMQIKRLSSGILPVNMISVGRVFRSDAIDATHLPAFTQMECLVADREPVTIGNLKRELIDFLSFVFETDDLDIRFRTSYFPFVEPGVEVDFKFNGRWIEICGAGIVHPNVFKNCGIDGQVYGFAFGVGIERIVMIKHGITDIRYLCDTDTRVLDRLSI